MARLRLIHRCSDCLASFPKWSGRCPACGAWNSLVEEVEGPEDPLPAALLALAPGAEATPLSAIDATSGSPVPTRIDELDRVLGGGLVPGSVTLLGGEPGIGKSTLLLQLLAAHRGPSLYVTAEESAQQVRGRAGRLGALRDDVWLLAEMSIPRIVAAIDSVSPGIVVVDSIQTVVDPDLGGAPGSVAQVRGCAHRLVQEAKRRNLAVIVVGHVTKDGGLAGPRVLEHVVDTVLAFEGERHHSLRLLRAVKHRFGPVDELGLFDMTAGGLVGVPDASTLFLADRRAGVAGSVVVPAVEGHRPLLVEVQALTNKVTTGAPARRSAQGIDHGRLSMIIAVLERRAGLALLDHEIFASVVGGVDVTEPAADLGIALALVSAARNIALPDSLVAIGEIGLAGEVRQVGHVARRLAEASRLGFTSAIVPSGVPPGDTALAVTRVGTVAEALRAAGLC